MSFTRAGHLARYVPAARLGDPLSVIAENLRTSPVGVLPVLDRPTFGEGDSREFEARVVGVIDDAALARATSRISALSPFESNGHPFSSTPHEPVSALALSEITARDIMNSDVTIVPSVFTLENTLQCLDNSRFPALPVIDEAGLYRGVISRADVVSAMTGGIRPPMVGGMATPLGVWLTDGRLTGGAPALGLFLSGVVLALCLFVSDIVPQVVLSTFNQNWGAMWTSGRLTGGEPGYGFFPLVSTFAHGLFFLGLLRVLPMAGIHAAEHQTVWALERGLPLEREYVSQMPRAHPRCGTNLMAISGMILVGAQHLPWLTPQTLLLLMIAVFFLWRGVGTWMQNELTTRPATPEQLDSGIAAAKELMAKYQAEPQLPPPFPLRLLNSGLLWSFMGMSVTLYLTETIRDYIMRAILATASGS